MIAVEVVRHEQGISTVHIQVNLENHATTDSPSMLVMPKLIAEQLLTSLVKYLKLHETEIKVSDMIKELADKPAGGRIKR